MKLKLNKKRWNKFKGGVRNVAGNIGKSLKEYEQKAPARREAKVTRLKQEIKVAKLQKQLSNLKKQNINRPLF